MIELPPIEELREARRRLAQATDFGVRRYAAMLQEVSTLLPGTYVAQPLLPETSAALPSSVVNVDGFAANHPVPGAAV